MSAAVAELKTRGFESPYLENFVGARIDRMLASAKCFDASRIDAGQVARSGGAAA